MYMFKRCLLVLFFTPLLLLVSVYGESGVQKKNLSPKKQTSLRTESYSIKNDIAFVSVWGSRPEAKELQGFQRAVLYNARGEVVQKIDMGRDSIYSLDKMIQENKTRGPLFIRMYRK
jgi:hypothetical protein